MPSSSVRIAASVACADFWRLEQQVRMLEKAKVDLLHIDIMDGVFVPNFCLSPDFIAMLHKFSTIPIDVHLMIVEPQRYIEKIAEAGADILCFHAETTHCMHRLIDQIKKCGMKAGVAINPSTPLSVIEYILPRVDMVTLMSVDPGFYGQKFIPEVFDKISFLREMIEHKGYQIEIEVDGNINLDNARKSIQAGANVLVAGTSSIFTGEAEIDRVAEKFRQSLNN